MKTHGSLILCLLISQLFFSQNALASEKLLAVMDTAAWVTQGSMNMVVFSIVYGVERTVLVTGALLDMYCLFRDQPSRAIGSCVDMCAVLSGIPVLLFLGIALELWTRTEDAWFRLQTQA